MSVEKVALRLVVTGDTSGARAALKGIGTESGKLGKALKTAQIGAAAGLAGIAGLAEAGRLSYEKLTASVASLQRQSKISVSGCLHTRRPVATLRSQYRAGHAGDDTVLEGDVRRADGRQGLGIGDAGVQRPRRQHGRP